MNAPPPINLAGAIPQLVFEEDGAEAFHPKESANALDNPLTLLKNIAIGILPKSVITGGNIASKTLRRKSPRKMVPDPTRRKSGGKKSRTLTQFIHSETEKIEIDSTNGKSLLKRAMAFLLHEDWYAAISDLQSCINLIPSDSRLFFDLGLVYEVCKKREDADKSYQKSIEFLPFLPTLATSKSNKKTHINQNLEPYQVYRRRAVNLYRSAIEPSSTEKSKTTQLYHAKNLIKMATYLFQESTFRDAEDQKIILYNDRAMISFHSTFNRKTIRDYYETTWEIVRLVILGIQDKNSLFAMFADIYFVWHFIVTNLEPVMKDSGYPDFPGFSFIDPVVFKRIDDTYTYLSSMDVNEEYKARCQYFINRQNPQPPQNPFGLPVVDRLTPECWRIPSCLKDWVGHIPCKISMLKQKHTFPLENRIDWEPPIHLFRLRLADESILGEDHLVVSDSWWSVSRGILRFTCADLSYPEGTYTYDLQKDKDPDSNIYRGYVRCVNGNMDDVLPGATKKVVARAEPLPLPYKDVHDWIVSLTQPRHLRHQTVEAERLKISKARKKHKWTPVQLKKPKWCKHCGYHIKSWGLTTHYQCSWCQMTVHAKCVDQVVLTCYGTNPSLTVSQPFVVPRAAFL